MSAVLRDTAPERRWDITPVAAELTKPKTDAEIYAERLEADNRFERRVMGTMFRVGVFIAVVAVFYLSARKYFY